MHDFVVFDVVQQRRRDAVRVARHEDGDAGNSRDSIAAEIHEECIDRQSLLFETNVENLPSAPPRRQQRVDHDSAGCVVERQAVTPDRAAAAEAAHVRERPRVQELLAEGTAGCVGGHVDDQQGRCDREDAVCERLEACCRHRV